MWEHGIVRNDIAKVLNMSDEAKPGKGVGRKISRGEQRKKDHKIVKKTENSTIKGALNPNFLNLTINREKFWL